MRANRDDVKISINSIVGDGGIKRPIQLRKGRFILCIFGVRACLLLLPSNPPLTGNDIINHNTKLVFC